MQGKVKVIQEFSQHKYCEFLGLVNFYHCFIPHCADILQPLCTLLANVHKNHKVLQWNEESLQAFSKIKQGIADVSLLSHPHTYAPTNIMTDASCRHSSRSSATATKWKPIAFFLKKLKPTEIRYSTFDCELLALYLSIKHFQHFVKGRQFHVITDHKPLTFALATQSSKLTPCQIRHLNFISQFPTDVCHVKGSDNPVAPLEDGSGPTM